MDDPRKQVTGVVTPADDARREAAADDTTKVFQSREEVEQQALFYRGRHVTLKDSIWDGSNKVFIPKWSMETSFELGKTITTIIAILFPNDWFFLASLDTTRVATAAARLYHVLFENIYPQMCEVVQYTLRSSTLPSDGLYHVPMTDEEFSKFKRAVSPQDFMEIFVSIVEQEINNQVMQALSKKVQRLLGERFALENAFPNISELMEEASTSLLEQLRSSSSQSSTNTPK